MFSCLGHNRALIDRSRRTAAIVTTTHNFSPIIVPRISSRCACKDRISLLCVRRNISSHQSNVEGDPILWDRATRTLLNSDRRIAEKDYNDYAGPSSRVTEVKYAYTAQLCPIQEKKPNRVYQVCFRVLDTIGH